MKMLKAKLEHSTKCYEKLKSLTFVQSSNLSDSPLGLAIRIWATQSGYVYIIVSILKNKQYALIPQNEMVWSAAKSES